MKTPEHPDHAKIKNAMEAPDPRDPNDKPAVFQMGHRFIDGPAAGVSLMLKRAPWLLRLVVNRSGVWDGLDQPEDAPKPQESIVLYVLASRPGYFHMRAARGGGGGVYRPADYRVVEPQPAEADMRENRRYFELTRKLMPTVVDAWLTPAAREFAVEAIAAHLSPPQASWIRLLADGRDPTARFTNQAQYGGATSTEAKLRELALVDVDGRITQFGRDVAAETGKR